MGKTQDLKIRVPAELKVWLAARAKENVRSMNAEIITLLKAAQRDDASIFNDKNTPYSETATFKLKLSRAECLWLEAVEACDGLDELFEHGLEILPPNIVITCSEEGGEKRYSAEIACGKPFFENGKTQEQALEAAANVLSVLGSSLEDIEVTYRP